LTTKRVAFAARFCFELEQVLFIQSQFCFSDGETIHAEGCEADAYPSDEAARQSGCPPAGNPAVGLHLQTNELLNPLIELSAFRRNAVRSVGRVDLNRQNLL